MKNRFLVFGIALAVFASCERDDTSEIVINDNSVTTINNDEGTTNNEDIVVLTPASGAITEDTTLEASKEYRLTGATIVSSGVTLTVEPGTIIKAEVGPNVYLAVEQGAQIMAEGTASNPIIFTSNSTTPTAGDWGGIILLGRAPVNSVTGTATATSEIGNLPYGGNITDDNSGILRYVRVQYSGGAADGQSENNGFSFYGIGNGTTIEYIQAFEGADDGVEFFGGTVSAKNLYLENNEDDSVDWTEGWNGKVTNTYISHTIDNFSTAFEGDKVNGNPQFENLTAISTTGGTGLQFKKQSGATITNIWLEGYDTNIDMKDDGDLSNVKIDGADASTTADYKTGTKVDVSTWSWKSAGL